MKITVEYKSVKIKVKARKVNPWEFKCSRCYTLCASWAVESECLDCVVSKIEDSAR